VVSWLCAPYDTSIIFCSTTTKAQKQKGWGEIQSIHRVLCEQAEEPVGNMIASQMVWEFTKGDSKNAILVKAVTDGDVNKAAADIQGHHTKNQIVVIDEAEAVPPAIWKACANLYSYPQQSGGYFLLAAIANVRSRLSNFGRYIEPAAGWPTVSIESDGWDGKPQMDGSPCKVLIFNFNRSPNILEGKVVSKHIPTAQRVAMRMKFLKERGMENDPDHFCYDLGFPAPEGLSKTIYTETLLEKFSAYAKHEFAGPNFLILGVIDPAYTPDGDRPAIRFGAMGDLMDGRKGLEWMDPAVLSIDATSPEPPKYQLLHQIKARCAAVEYRGQKVVCEPKNFGFDITGDSGLWEIARKEWSQDVIGIMYNGAPSDDPCSSDDPRPAREVYENKRAEMFFLNQVGISSGQIKGVDKDTASELCSIEEIDMRPDGTMRRLKTVMNKKLYRLKFRKSCDFADCGIMLYEVARQKGFTLTQTGEAVAMALVNTEQRIKEIQELRSSVDFSAENEKAMWENDDDDAFAYAEDDQ
jgi:hypothetical protein